ncbi:hypothetical protein HK101_005615 [Irineochytrium annulatum]|nr:hypothetical protein HK101_005615 [Irineochytrium annulatum]
MLTRPVDDSRFSKVDIAEVINSRLKTLDFRVEAVDPSIVDAIDRKINGNPLYLQMTIDILISKIGNELSVKNTVLVAENAELDIETLLLDLEPAILSQFDQLNHGFQNLLKFATFFGQVRTYIVSSVALTVCPVF